MALSMVNGGHSAWPVASRTGEPLSEMNSTFGTRIQKRKMPPQDESDNRPNQRLRQTTDDNNIIGLMTEIHKSDEEQFEAGENPHGTTSDNSFHEVLYHHQPVEELESHAQQEDNSNKENKRFRLYMNSPNNVNRRTTTRINFPSPDSVAIRISMVSEREGFALTSALDGQQPAETIHCKDASPNDTSFSELFDEKLFDCGSNGAGYPNSIDTEACTEQGINDRASPINSLIGVPPELSLEEASFILHTLAHPENVETERTGPSAHSRELSSEEARLVIESARDAEADSVTINGIAYTVHKHVVTDRKKRDECFIISAPLPDYKDLAKQLETEEERAQYFELELSKFEARTKEHEQVFGRDLFFIDRTKDGKYEIVSNQAGGASALLWDPADQKPSENGKIKIPAGRKPTRHSVAEEQSSLLRQCLRCKEVFGHDMNAFARHCLSHRDLYGADELRRSRMVPVYPEVFKAYYLRNFPMGAGFKQKFLDRLRKISDTG